MFKELKCGLRDIYGYTLLIDIVQFTEKLEKDRTGVDK